MKSETKKFAIKGRLPISRPDFLIVGAMKSGTTTLHGDLLASPEIFIPSQKEPEILYRAQSPAHAVELYRRYFRGAREGQVLGEATTTYTMMPDFPSIAAFASGTLQRGAKIFYIVRDPLERARSHVFHDLTVGRIGIDEADTALLDHPRYLAVSDYTRQIAPWVEAFGLDNVHIISFETYVSCRLGIVNEVLRLLGCAPLEELDTAKVRNQKGLLGRPRFPVMNSIINNNFAQMTLRGLLPKGISKAAKAVLIKRTSVPALEFSPEVLAAFEARLAALPGLRQSFPELILSIPTD